VKITRDSNDIAEFDYDALGRRVRKIDHNDSNNSRLYYYSIQWQVLSEYNTSNSWKTSYVYGNFIDEPLYMTSTDGNYYYVQNHLYSTVALVDDSGNVAERYEYDAYGNAYILEPNFAADPDGESDYGNPYLFTGRCVDILDNGSLKIQYNRHRYYDYVMGRWYTMDPLGTKPAGNIENTLEILTQYTEGLHLYEYVKSNPINYVDPYGLLTCDYKIICRKIHPKNWQKKLLRKFNIRHCDLRKKWLVSVEFTVFPVWVMAHPESRKLQAGAGKGCACKCARCDQIESCIEDIKERYPHGSMWPNCHTQTKRAVDACCLNTTWEPGFFAF